MTSENNELFDLLKQGKWEEALPALREYLKKDATDAEKGKVFVMLAEAYMNVATEINERESAAMQEISNILQDLDETEHKYEDEAGLANARSVINS